MIVAKYLSRLYVAILCAYLLLAAALLYWQVIRAPDLLTRPDNPRPYVTEQHDQSPAQAAP